MRRDWGRYQAQQGKCSSKYGLYVDLIVAIYTEVVRPYET